MKSEPGAKILAGPSGPTRERLSESPTSDRWSGSGKPTEPDAESSPVLRQARELVERGEYASAVRFAYRAAFDDTVRSYGLVVPPFCSDRQFLNEFLRPDMGKLTDLLPELYRRYEPVRFGRIQDGDRISFLALLQRLYSETALGRIDDPLFQPNGPANPVEKNTFSVRPSHLSRG